MPLIRPLRIEGDVAYVPLTQGYEAVIDLADAEEIGRYNWFILRRPHTVYAVRNAPQRGNKLLLMHRVLLSATEGETVDHINHCGWDNRRANLRFASPQQNCANSRLRRDNTSGAKGVDWRKDRQKWRAQITLNGATKSLGHFNTREDAEAAFNRAAAETHGPFFFRGF